jgi:hypothetical protein
VFELLVQKNCMEHELQRSAAAAAAAVQQAVRGRLDAEAATRHSRTRLDAAAAEIQALQAQVRAVEHVGHASHNADAACSSQTERRGALLRRLQLQPYAPNFTSRHERGAALCRQTSFRVIPQTKTHASFGSVMQAVALAVKTCALPPVCASAISLLPPTHRLPLFTEARPTALARCLERWG